MSEQAKTSSQPDVRNRLGNIPYEITNYNCVRQIYDKCREPSRSVVLILDPKARPFKLGDIFASLEKTGQYADAVEGIGFLGASNVCEIIFASWSLKQAFLEVESIMVKGKLAYTWDPLNCSPEQTAKLFWLPSGVLDEEICKALEPFATDVKVQLENVQLGERKLMAKTNVRILRFKLKQGLKVGDVPQMLKLEQGQRGLLLIKGAAIRCFRCDQIGHFVKECKVPRGAKEQKEDENAENRIKASVEKVEGLFKKIEVSEGRSATAPTAAAASVVSTNGEGPPKTKKNNLAGVGQRLQDLSQILQSLQSLQEDVELESVQENNRGAEGPPQRKPKGKGKGKK